MPLCVPYATTQLTAVAATSPRAHCLMVPRDPVSGVVLTSATVNVYQPNTTTPVTGTLYDEFGNVLSNPLTSDPSTGIVDFYMQIPQKVDLNVAKASYITQTYSNVTVINDGVYTIPSVVTNTGDLPYGNAANNAVALHAGAPGSQLQMGSNGLPTWIIPPATIALSNQLVNGGFEVKQRGGSITVNATGAYAHDRWFVSNQGINVKPTGTATDDTTIVDIGSEHSLKMTITSTGSVAASNGLTIVQTLEGTSKWVNVPVSFSIRVRPSIANSITISLLDSGSNPIAQVQQVGTVNTWTTVTLSGVGSTAGGLTVKIVFGGVNMVTNCFCNFDNAMLIVGETPIAYVPLPAADELARCQRYYEVIGVDALNNHPSFQFYAGAGGEVWAFPISWNATKGGQPAVTIVGAFTTTNVTSVAVYAASSSGATISVTATSSGATQVIRTADGVNGITVEWNP